MQHFVIGNFSHKARTAHMFLKVATVVVRTVARPRHLPHCNVAVVFPNEHFQSSTVVYFLRRDSTCRGVFSLRGLPEVVPRHVVCHCPGCLATMFCHMRFCNWSRSARKSFSPPFQTHATVAILPRPLDTPTGTWPRTSFPSTFFTWVLSHFIIAAGVCCGVLPLCEGGGDVVGVVTPLVRGVAQDFHGDQVVELSGQLGVEEVEGKEEDKDRWK